MKKILLMIALLLAVPAASQAQTDASPAASSDAAQDQPAPGGEAKEQGAQGEADDLGALGQEALALAKAGKWFALLGTLMLLMIALFRRFILRRIDWFQTRIGGYAVAAGVTALTIGALALKVGMSMDVIMAGLTAGGVSISMHTTSKDLKSKASG